MHDGDARACKGIGLLLNILHCSRYPTPVDTQLLSQQSLQYHLNKDNYVQKMHSVINLEELHMQSVVAKLVCYVITEYQMWPLQ